METTTPTAGVFTLPSNEYFASSAVSNSDLKWITPPYTPAHFRAYKLGEMEKLESSALKIGTLIHSCVLEPGSISYEVRPDGIDGRSKEGKAWFASMEGQTVISAKEEQMVTRMMENVWAHKEARSLIAGSDHEQSLFAPDGDIWTKARIDCLTRSGNVLADLKTCELSDLASVEASIFKYGYYRQAAYYLRIANRLGLEKSAFVFIFVEKTPPYCVATYNLSDEALEMGEVEIEASLSNLKHCYRTGEWPGREPGINEASVPNWALLRAAV